MKKLISLFIAYALILSCLGSVAFASEGSKIDNVKIGQPEYYGYPLRDSYVDSSVCSKQDGNNIIATVIEGSPSVFYVYDLDNNKVLGQYPIDGASYCHGFGVAPNGDIYATTQTQAKLVRYSVSTKKFEVLGEYAGETASYQVSFDEEGNAYVGTYPSAKIIKYDPKTNEFYDYGNILDGEKYVRAQVYYNGYIYASGYHPETKFVKLNVKTGEITKLNTPVFDGVLPLNGIKLFYFMDLVSDPVAGDFIIAHVYPLKGVSLACVYDLKQEKWVDYFDAIYGYQFPRQLNDGVTYVPKNFAWGTEGGGTQNRIAAYNFRTGEVTDTGITYREPGIGEGFRGASLIELKDQAKYPGKSIVTVHYDLGVPAIINLETKNVEILKDVQNEIFASPIQIRSIGSGTNNLVGYGGYKAREGGVFDTTTTTFKNIPMEQTEGIDAVGDKMYYGKYAGAVLFEYDPAKPTVKGENPKQVSRLYEDQDRIFDISPADGKVLMSSSPITTSLGGALSIYDPQTGQTDVYRNLVNNQSIASAVYKDGKVYASTHVFGGLGLKPTESHAKIIKFDMETRKVEQVIEPNIEGYGGDMLHIGGMEVGADGLIWAVSKGTIMGINPETMAIEKSKVVAPGGFSKDKEYYVPYDIHNLKNGLMAVKFSTGISIFDPETLDVKRIFETAYRFTVAEDGNIYSTDYKNFIKFPVYYEGEALKSENEVDEKLGKSIALMLDKNEAFVNGTKKPIDANDSGVVAKTIDGRTVVPFRFIAESVGGEVEWNDATQTASVKVNGKTVSTVIGENKIFIDGVEKQIDVPAVTENGRTLLPLRAFVEALDKKVFWDPRGLILISDNEEFVAQNKELLDKTIHKFKPEILSDPQQNGKTDPKIEEWKKNVIINKPKYTTSTDKAQWGKVPLANGDFEAKGLITKAKTEEGASGFDAYVDGLQYGKGAEKVFDFLNKGEAYGADFAKYPQSVEIVSENSNKLLKVNIPHAGNAVNMFLGTVYFDSTYTNNMDYKVTFKAKVDEKGGETQDKSIFSALVRFSSGKSTNLYSTKAIRIEPSADLKAYEITVPRKDIPKDATNMSLLIYVSSKGECIEGRVDDIEISAGK